MNLIDDTITAPPKIIVYGGPGAGKTTLAADAEAVLIDAENGASAMRGLLRTPYLQRWPDIRAWLAQLWQSWPAGRNVLAIDTLDWLTHRIVEHVVLDLDQRRSGDLTSTLNAAHGGYGRAREIVQNIVHRELIPALEAHVGAGRAVLLLAHAAHVRMTTPEGYDVRTAAPDLPAWLAPTWIEWADAVLYLRQADDIRELVTRTTATILAKNRYGMPPVIAPRWSEIMAAIQRR